MNSGIESQTTSQMTALIAATLRVPELHIARESAFLEDLGADSLDFVSLILAIENEFQIDISDEDAAELLTVKEMIEYVTFALAMKETNSGRLHTRSHALLLR